MNARLTGATEEVVRQWFDCLGDIMREYSVASTNMLNIDDVGFMLVQVLESDSFVIVSTGDLAARFRTQPGTRESTAVIECIGSGGQVEVAARY